MLNLIETNAQHLLPCFTKKQLSTWKTAEHVGNHTVIEATTRVQ